MVLTEERCEACHVGAPTVTLAEEAELKPQIPDWQLIEVDGERRLQRSFTFKGWRSAVRFTNAVAELANKEGHHPAILTEWGKVTVTWWTHAIHGLHRNDFIAAAKTDELFSARS
ncbi:MAG: 4a-hydroxytetrahydrobiopterin dehydratase [Thermomicrobiales bacterium]